MIFIVQESLTIAGFVDGNTKFDIQADDFDKAKTELSKVLSNKGYTGIDFKLDIDGINYKATDVHGIIFGCRRNPFLC